MRTFPLKISIITPNYNYGNYIGQTIQSILSQDYDLIEHIIVDDGSTDNSIEIISNFTSKYPDRVKLIQKEHGGQTAAINRGLSEATGEIIGWINSDDIYYQDSIKQIADEFTKNINIDIVYGDLYIIDNESRITSSRKQLPIDMTAGSLIGFGILVASNTIFWRTNLIKKIGFLNEEFTCNMDGEYFSRLFYAGGSKHIKIYVAGFRVHSLANSSDFNPVKMKRYEYELNFELQRSYSKLLISKAIPYKYSKPIKMLFKAKRGMLRFIQGHYFNLRF